MQLLLNVKNDKVLDNLVWMLEHFKDDGVEIVIPINQDQPLPKYTDGYIEKNWKEMLLNLKNIPNYTVKQLTKVIERYGLKEEGINIHLKKTGEQHATRSH